MAATIKLIGITATGMEGFGMVGTGIQVIGILAQWSSWLRIDVSIRARNLEGDAVGRKQAGSPVQTEPHPTRASPLGSRR
jgi:hypothetical protein